MEKEDGRMKIIGAERSLDEVIEGKIILSEIIEQNVHEYKKAWKFWLPSEKQNADNSGKMSYIPVVCMRKCYHPEVSGRTRDIPYLVFILNQGRENRPKSEDKGTNEKDDSHCKLCKNILSKDMIISEIDDYFLTPNGFPYHNYASLLINKDNKRQGDINHNDISTWMKASVLLDQYVFFNSWGAGASIREHQHAQMVDPTVIKLDNEIVPYLILNRNIVSREPVNGKEDVFRLRNYIVDGLIFTGSDAAHKACYAAHLIDKDGDAFNILVNKDEVYVISRNRERETSICMRRKVGGYEISGIPLLGDIEEISGGTEIKMKGAIIFSNMDYWTVIKNLKGASKSVEGIAKKF